MIALYLLPQGETKLGILAGENIDRYSSFHQEPSRNISPCPPIRTMTTCVHTEWWELLTSLEPQWFPTRSSRSPRILGSYWHSDCVLVNLSRQMSLLRQMSIPRQVSIPKQVSLLRQVSLL